ncbi:MAG TPA: NAD(P)-dependent oxidoreductase [Allosphingosinicella sp.]
MNNILITGAGGLLGSHLVPLLAGRGQVFATARSVRPETVDARIVPLDLSREIDLSALPAKVDSVIYLAQSSRFREFPDAADDILAVNVAQPIALLDYARRAGARNFVYASTGGVYGSGDNPLVEDSPAPPPGQTLGFYPATKRAAEILAEAWSPYLNVAILRFFFIYGAGQKRDMLVPRLIDSVRQGRPVTLQGEDGLSINPIHVSDAAIATAAAAALERSATLNVAGPEVLSLRGMCDIIGRKLGREPAYETQPDRKPADLVADISAMRDLLHDPAVRFEEGVEDLVETAPDAAE